MDKISIIVPIYKVEPYLRRCVDSVLAQTYEDFELILVDDGSPDRCGEICDDYAARDFRIKVIHRENGGLSAARNSGLDVATGELIFFLDSDDYLEKSALATFVSSMDGEDVVSFGRIIETDEGVANEIWSFPEESTDLPTPLSRMAFVVGRLLQYRYGWEAWGRVFRRSVIEAAHLRFEDNAKIFAEDICFFVCYMLVARRHKCIGAVLYHYVVRSDSIMGKHDLDKIERVVYLSDAIWKFARTVQYEKSYDRYLAIIDYRIIWNEITRAKNWEGLCVMKGPERMLMREKLKNARRALGLVPSISLVRNGMMTVMEILHARRFVDKELDNCTQCVFDAILVFLCQRAGRILRSMRLFMCSRQNMVSRRKTDCAQECAARHGRVAVIVPVYNVEPYLRRCVDSILAQTYKQLELILVDDGSPDNCGRICDEYACADDRIIVIHQQNAGLSAARNAGLDSVQKRGSADYVTFIDSDDAVAPDYLSELVNALHVCGTEISTVRIRDFSSEELPVINTDICEITKMSVEAYWCAQDMLPMIACGKLFPVRTFIDLRFPVGKVHEDEFLTHQLIFQFKVIAVVSARSYFYFKRAGSITHSDRADRRAMALDAIESQLDYFREKGLLRARRASVRNLRLLFAREFKALSSGGDKNQEELRLLYERFRFDLRNRFFGFSECFEAQMTVAYVRHPIVMRIPWLFYRAVGEVAKVLERLICR